MKSILSIFLSITCLLSVSRAAEERPPPDSVVVKVLGTALPRDETKRSEFLWATFAHKPEERRFASYTTDNWETNFNAFAKSLVQKAKKQKLNSQALQKALDLVLKQSGGTAYLPIGAYQTTLDRNLVWIVTIKWESPSMGEGVALSHIRMFAFEQKTMKQVAFETCL
jgi:hypothetical protein